VVAVEELRDFWRRGWKDVTTQAARAKPWDLLDYAPKEIAAALFLRCRLLQQLKDDGVELSEAVFEKAARVPVGKGFEYASFRRTI